MCYTGVVNHYPSNTMTIRPCQLVSLIARQSGNHPSQVYTWLISKLSLGRHYLTADQMLELINLAGVTVPTDCTLAPGYLHL